MGVHTNEHNIADLLARMAIQEQNYLRLESKIDKKLDDLFTAIGGLKEFVVSAKSGWWVIARIGLLVSGLAVIVIGIAKGIRN